MPPLEVVTPRTGRARSLLAGPDEIACLGGLNTTMNDNPDALSGFGGATIDGTSATRGRVERLQAEIADLESRLQDLRAELGEALRDQDEARAQEAAARQAQAQSAVLVDVCQNCDGHGTFWIHDIEMPCRDCRGTGYLTGRRATGSLPTTT